LVLPIGPNTGCNITFPRAAEGRWLVDVTLDHSMGDLLLRYQAREMRDEVSTILRSPQLQFEGLLGPKPHPVAAVVCAYARLPLATAEDIQSWIHWAEKLMRIAPWMADGAIVYAECLARLGKHGESYSALIEATRRGPPLFKKGLDHAIPRLGLYTGRFSRRPTNDRLPEAQEYLSILERLAASASSLPCAVVSAPGGMEDDFLAPTNPPTLPDGERSLGIHLGRRMATLGVMNGLSPVVLANEEGAFSTPAVVALDEDGHWVVGNAAQRQPHAFSAGNRLFAEGSEDNSALITNRRPLSKSEAWTILLSSLRELAEFNLGEPRLQVAIAVPATATDLDRESMRQACENAGFPTPLLISEPAAAALAYSLDRHCGNVVVYELRRRAFSVSVMAVGRRTIDIKAMITEPALGGNDIDELIINYFRTALEPRVEIPWDAAAHEILLQAAERVKIELSTASEAQVNLSGLGAVVNAGAPFPRMNRQTLERLSRDVIERTIVLCKAALTKAGITAVDNILLLGGVTRMPLVQKSIESLFGGSPLVFDASYHLAVGAAVAAANEERLAADVLPLSIGIETLGGLFNVMIERNTKLPARKTETFSTAQDNQLSVEVKVFQGERALAKDNRLLAVFQLGGISPAPRGVPQIEVIFEMDEEGRLNVTARDRSRDNEEKLTVTATSGLRRVEVQQRARDAELHANEDRQARALLEARNRADAQVYNVEKMLREHTGRIDDENEQAIRRSIDVVREALRVGDAERVNSAYDVLVSASQKLAEVIYRRPAKEDFKQGVVESEFVDIEEEK
jgi:molecular chaperone DnaK